jgi:hypothetical protein
LAHGMAKRTTSRVRTCGPTVYLPSPHTKGERVWECEKARESMREHEMYESMRKCKCIIIKRRKSDYASFGPWDGITCYAILVILVCGLKKTLPNN